MISSIQSIGQGLFTFCGGQEEKAALSLEPPRFVVENHQIAGVLWRGKRGALKTLWDFAQTF